MISLTFIVMIIAIIIVTTADLTVGCNSFYWLNPKVVYLRDRWGEVTRSRILISKHTGKKYAYWYSICNIAPVYLNDDDGTCSPTPVDGASYIKTWSLSKIESVQKPRI